MVVAINKEGIDALFLLNVTSQPFLQYPVNSTGNEVTNREDTLYNHDESVESDTISHSDVMADNSTSKRRRNKRRSKKSTFLNDNSIEISPSAEIKSNVNLEYTDFVINEQESEVDSEIASVNVTVKKTQTHEDYRVDSPKLCEKKITKKNGSVVKSRSLDDEEIFKIVEISESGSEEKISECNAVISEAESEVEWETVTEIEDTKKSNKDKFEKLNIQIEDVHDLTNEFDAVNVADSETEVICNSQNFGSALDIKTKKQQKRLELAEYFTPVYQNPRYLEAISEESSDFSDKECKESKYKNKKQNVQVTKPSLNLKNQKVKNIKGGSEIQKKMQSHYQGPINEKTLLLDTKLIGSSDVTQGICETIQAEKSSGVEIVFLDDSSTSESAEEENEEFADAESEQNESDSNILKKEIHILSSELTPPPASVSITHKDEFGETGKANEKKEKVEVKTISQKDNAILDKKAEELLIKDVQEAAYYHNALSPPPLSRSPSVASDTSSSVAVTAHFIPQSSSVGDVTTILKDVEQLKDSSKLHEPLKLKEICLKILLSLPFGPAVLQELADVSKSLEEITNTFPNKPIPLPVKANIISQKLPAFITKLEDENASINENLNILVKTKDKTMENKWIGLPTEDDPNVLVCLSPKQKERLDETKKIPNEAGKLLDLHEKFSQRRGYHEEHQIKIENSKTPVNTENNRLLEIILQKNKESVKAEKQSKDDDTYLYFVEKEPISSNKYTTNNARLKAKDLSEWLSLARDKSKSNIDLRDKVHFISPTMRSTSSAWQLSSERSHRHFNNLNDFDDYFDSFFSKNRRSSLPSNFFRQQMDYILKKEREIQEELEKLEEEKLLITQMSRKSLSPKVFEPDEYRISKQGDIAIHQTGKPWLEFKDKNRPKSMPVAPTEFFRQQMYEEYMNKIAARDERKHQNIIKLSSATHTHNEREDDKKIQKVGGLGDEFVDKAKKRLNKHGIILDDSDSEKTLTGSEYELDEMVLLLDGDSILKTKTVPKHLKEFVDLTKFEDFFDENVNEGE